MIYIHIPFCHRKCTYCAFYSTPSLLRVEDYADALLKEMEHRRGEQAHPVRTIYFGGGTPSLLPVRLLARMVEALRRGFDLTRLSEATIECNPEDLTADYLHALADLHFFNRISLGVQSLDDATLRLIGRRHTARQAIEAIEMAYRMGFKNISVDFIYGIGSVDKIQAIAPLSGLLNHVSAYALTVEPGTALSVQIGQGRVALPDEDEVVMQYHALRRWLLDEGFIQYEVSNFARPGYESQHNSRYWNRTPYLGLGPGAHSLLSDGRRRWNYADLGRYIDNPLQAFGEETLTEADECNEWLMTSLRTTAGIDLDHLPQQYRNQVWHKALRYVESGWLVHTGTRLIPSDEGLLHADGIAADLFV